MCCDGIIIYLLVLNISKYCTSAFSNGGSLKIHRQMFTFIFSEI